MNITVKFPVRSALCAVLITWLVLASQPTFAQQPSAEAFAIVANDRTLAASVGSQVGRSPFLLLFDKHGALIEAMDNPYKNAGNAGVSTVELLASKGINVLVSEGFGPKIVGVMKEKGIRAVEFSGSVSAALKKVRQQ